MFPRTWRKSERQGFKLRNRIGRAFFIEGVVDNHQTIEEPDAVKIARPVLKEGREERSSLPTQLSYRDLEEMMAEHGVAVDHFTIKILLANYEVAGLRAAKQEVRVCALG